MTKEYITGLIEQAKELEKIVNEVGYGGNTKLWDKLNHLIGYILALEGKDD